jgi:chromosome segregation protein
MSGGEKALTALAFLFAIQMYESAPFYFFDEADAALDRENSEKLARMIGQISRESQFVAITHNDSLIREAHQIIGVALNEQKSSVIGLKLKENSVKI